MVDQPPPSDPASSTDKPAGSASVPSSSHGMISLFTRHPTAANLLTAVLVIWGIVAIGRLNAQFFPTMEIPIISVSVAWSGASAEDVEENILKALEPELRFLDGLEKVDSTAREGSGTVSLEFASSADMQKALSDTESAISALTTLPDGSERPVVKRIAFYEPVARVALSGPFPEESLKSFAKTMRDGLLAAGIDRVDLSGDRDEEYWIEVAPRELRRLDIGLTDVANRVAMATDDRPSGTLEGDIDRQVRTLGGARSPDALGKIELVSRSGGEKVLLNDIATIKVAFDRDAVTTHVGEERAISLTVQRTVTSDTLEAMDILQSYLAEAMPGLPPTLEVKQYRVQAAHLSGRIWLLVKNGLGGLILVVGILFLFLNARVAFWVAFGIPVSMMATLGLMLLTGQSINMISLFALILTLGIIVDDAIVVGEHAVTLKSRGLSALEAAERGAARMFRPVTAAILTTQVAFLPMFVIGGRIGDVMSALPMVVIVVLTASLVECFLILPCHLKMALSSMDKKPGRFRARFDELFDRFRDGPFTKIARTTYRWRYVTLAVSVASLIVAIGFLAGGRVSFQFFPAPEAENINIRLTMGAGTPRDYTENVLREVETNIRQTSQKIAPEGEELIHMAFGTVGQAGKVAGDNVAQLAIELTAGEIRTVRTKDILREWRRALPKLPGVERISVTAQRGGPPGRDIDILLENGPVTSLKAAAEELAVTLLTYPGVSGVSDDLPYGKDEVILELTPRGGALGFDSDRVGRQVRAALSGIEARRFARSDEEITIRVLNPAFKSGIEALRSLYLRSPDGRDVPLIEIVTMRQKPGFSRIQRREGKRSVSVSADVDSEITTNIKVTDALEASALPELATKYGITYRLSGRAEERAESFKDVRLGFIISLATIYIILAWVFASYVRPIVVMGIIPFGFVGTLFGHYLLGYDLSVLSLFGLLGLTGILVNDSIILMTELERRSADGDVLEEASVGASAARLRAVLLTSLTTICGLLPLMFETSLQAQFLIPMAITLVFGLAVATALVLFLVPALVGIEGDIRRGVSAYANVWKALIWRLSGRSDSLPNSQ